MKTYQLAAIAAAAAACGMVATGGDPALVGQVAAGMVVSLLAGTLAYRSQRPDTLDGTVGLFLGWALLSALLATPDPLASKETLGMWAGSAVLLSLVRSGAVTSRKELRTVITVTAFMVVLALATTAVLTGSPFSGGLFENPNLAAAVLISALPVLTTASSQKLRFGGAIVTAGAIALTGSRAGLVALVVVTAVLVRGRARWIVAGVAAAAGAGLIWWRLATRPDALAWFRVEIWEAVLRLTALHPVTGVSPGGLGDMSGVVRLATPIGCSLHARHIGGAESSLLGVLVRTGVVGALLALAVALALFLAARRLPRGPERRAAWAVLSGCLVMMFFHDFLQEPSVLWWWAVMVGFAVPRTPTARSGSRPALRTLVPALVAVGVVAWATVQPPLARLVVASEASPELAARRMLRFEPWDDRAARTAAASALHQENSWDWKSAGMALYWSRYVTRVHPGAAASWALSARVNARIVTELGAYPAALDSARTGFERACGLEPHLPWYWHDWATFERGLGNLKKARSLAVRATTEEPNCVRSWLLLARIDLDLGRVERARQDLLGARRARDCFRGRVLEAYERDLRWAPSWQWTQLEEAIP